MPDERIIGSGIGDIASGMMSIGRSSLDFGSIVSAGLQSSKVEGLGAGGSGIGDSAGGTVNMGKWSMVVQTLKSYKK